MESINFVVEKFENQFYSLFEQKIESIIMIIAIYNLKKSKAKYDGSIASILFVMYYVQLTTTATQNDYNKYYPDTTAVSTTE